jgi:hypothetical protein
MLDDEGWTTKTMSVRVTFSETRSTRPASCEDKDSDPPASNPQRTTSPFFRGFRDAGHFPHRGPLTVPAAPRVAARGTRRPAASTTNNGCSEANCAGRGSKVSRGDTRQANYNRGPFDIATLAIFPEYIEFDGEEVLRLVVEGAAGRTVA